MLCRRCANAASPSAARQCQTLATQPPIRQRPVPLGCQCGGPRQPNAAVPVSERLLRRPGCAARRRAARCRAAAGIRLRRIEAAKHVEDLRAGGQRTASTCACCWTFEVQTWRSRHTGGSVDDKNSASRSSPQHEWFRKVQFESNLPRERRTSRPTGTMKIQFFCRKLRSSCGGAGFPFFACFSCCCLCSCCCCCVPAGAPAPGPPPAAAVSPNAAPAGHRFRCRSVKPDGVSATFAVRFARKARG